MLLSNKIKVISQKAMLLSLLLLLNNYSITQAAPNKNKSVQDTESEAQTHTDSYEKQSSADKDVYTETDTQNSTNSGDTTADSTSSDTTNTVSDQTEVSTEPVTANPPVDFTPFVIDVKYNYLGKTKQILSDLLSLIHAGNVKSLKNPKQTKIYLNGLVDVITWYQTNKFNGIDQRDIIFGMLEVNEAIMLHISQELSNGLKTINPLSIEQLYKNLNKHKAQYRRKKSAKKDPFKEQTALLEKLSKQIDHIGLHWYNLAYRELDEAIIDPAIQSDVVPTSLQLGAAGLLLYGLWKESNKVTMATTFCGWNKDWISKKWDHEVKPFLVKHREITRNRLKGGIHNKMADKLAGQLGKCTFKDLIGLDHIVSQLRLVVDFMANSELYINLGTMPEKGYLFVGPPGTGKTFIVEALANEAAKVSADKKINFINITQEEIWKAGGIAAMFGKIKTLAPCICFFDEFDLLRPTRDGSTGILSEMLIHINALLAEQDPKKQIIIIAATNKPESIDEALTRSGRLHGQYRFKLPSLESREKVITAKLKKLGITFDNAQEAIHNIALQTEGASFPDLNLLVGEAFRYAHSLNETFGEKHLEYALNKTMRHITPHIREMIPAHELQIIATHFAGQALILTLIDSVAQLARVTTLPHMPKINQEALLKLRFDGKEATPSKEQDRYAYGAVYTYKPNDSADIYSKDELLKTCKLHLAGIVAEELMLGSASHTCNKDAMSSALEIAKIIVFEGLKESHMPQEEINRRFQKALQLIETGKKEVRTLLTANKPKLTALIAKLQEQKELSKEEVLAAIEAA